MPIRWLVFVAVLASVVGAFAAESEGKMRKSLWQAFTMARLADYVSLAPGVAPINRDRYVIGIVGASELQRDLQGLIASGKPSHLQRRPAEVVEIPQSELAERGLKVDLLFVAGSAQSQVFPLLEKCTRAGVVVIGETGEFTRRGGTLRFDEVRRTVVYHRANLSRAPYGLNYRFRKYLDSE